MSHGMTNSTYTVSQTAENVLAMQLHLEAL